MGVVRSGPPVVSHLTAFSICSKWRIDYLRLFVMLTLAMGGEIRDVATTVKFFDERSDQSEVKARIIEKYFYVWANVVMGAAKNFGGGKIAYIDLYAGPGRYKDGAASTPLLILERAIADPKLQDMLVTLFNEGDQGRAKTLEEEIQKLPNIGKLKHKPTVLCGPVDQDAEKYFNETRLVPSFSFIDPFGYKGLSLKIVNGVIKDWGCDCVFFFNYNRINAGFLTMRDTPQHTYQVLTKRADRLEELASQLPWPANVWMRVSVESAEYEWRIDQRQRIAIARALVTNPRILIFDEATSALDYESENIIQRNMRKIAAGRTVLIIAHRLSAVRHADRIITIEGGRLIEDGTHDELINRAGRYATLHQLQAGLHVVS
jgi:three-Cys-motif partner protein